MNDLLTPNYFAHLATSRAAESRSLVERLYFVRTPNELLVGFSRQELRVAAADRRNLFVVKAG